MSDRDVRKLAEEIQRAYERDLPVKSFELTDLTEWLVPTLTTLLAQRESDLQAQLHRALEELNLALACQEGLSDQVADLQATVARLEGERDRALGEGAGLREWIEAHELERCPVCGGLGWLPVLPEEQEPTTTPERQDVERAPCERCIAARAALTASPLSERAGAVIAAGLAAFEAGFVDEQETFDRFFDALIALRAELAKGGESG